MSSQAGKPVEMLSGSLGEKAHGKELSASGGGEAVVSNQVAVQGCPSEEVSEGASAGRAGCLSQDVQV